MRLENSSTTNVAIIASRFLGWNGGLDFLHRRMRAILEAEGFSQINLYVIFPKKNNNFLARFFLKLKIFFREKIIKKNADRLKSRLQNLILDRKFVNKEFFYLKNRAKIVFIKQKRQKLLKCFRKLGVKITIFGDEDLCDAIPNIAYYPDLQHRYLSQYFSQNEILKRDLGIAKTLQNSRAIIVNALAVKKDMEKFFPKESKNCEIFVLPYSPAISDHSWLENLPYDIFKKYNLPKKYFVISNQFWIHKNHLTAFRALRKLIDENKEFADVAIVCTGAVHDYRFPDFIKQIESEIKNLNLGKNILILGLIKRRDQIEIIKNSIAMIQPTLFEGAPGGGAFYDANALGKLTILSDIEVNFEIKDKTGVLYFSALDEEDLKNKMSKSIETNSIEKFSTEFLLERSKERLSQLGDYIINAALKIAN